MTKEISLDRIGCNIKAERVRAGLSQQQLSDISGVSINAIRGYEQGRVEGSFASIARIAAALDLSLDALTV